MRDNVRVMTEMFRSAMVFEQYKYLWDQALAQINQMMAQNLQSQNNALNGIKEEQWTIDNVDANYAGYTKQLQKVKKQRSLKRFLVPFIWIPPFTLIAIFLLWRDHGDAFTNTSKQLEGVSPEAADQQKLVSQNNIRNHQAFLEKAKREYAIMTAKKGTMQAERAKAAAALQEIYGKGWIPPTYQGLVPMATIYEYLNNGVCTIIRGHGGVYERYDDDLWKKEIAGDLKDIKRNQRIMIRNQQELNRMVSSINSTLGEIKREVQYSNEMLQDIRTNTGIAASAAQQSAAYQEYVATAVWRSL